ncbi:FAD-dependent oxidoreductase [[Clostridium] symbiosum]|uniref:oxidoreductase n=1 Tax=Clostridium symbiosum TaxID=1512 RepID=UPI00157105B0|nr:FAD-dependent oxidoreductase [[Clostridium] symbiosum]MBS6221541.1 FAD-dependent oxidoreductase [[Clostridium] symbiosum]MCQ4988961.1 FAD-dependent oxidoreductase [[Clostridium] symbiosum]NSF84975.1 FAD-dependent oxidoreductase [[Clostridium] symbiosum]NSJ01635.1 FAD-dependent oxidoreductase [[Clostridium] symbiosum]
MASNYPHLFSPIIINGRRIRNRIASAPMSHRGEIPRYTRQAQEFFSSIAKGGAGIVGMGEAGVDSRVDICHPYDSHLDHPVILPSLAGAIDAIHLWGALASIELVHSGNRAHPDYIPSTSKIIGPCEMTNLYGASVIAMDEAMMEETADKYAYAAYMAQYAGIDIINIHLGHGWLLSQFLSNLDNHRTDKYGGSLENRARFPLMVIDRIRQKCGDKMIIEVRISGEEDVEGGLTKEDSVELAKMLDDKVEIIHISAGTFHLTDTAARMFPTAFTPRGCNTHVSEAVKKVCKHAKIAVVGGLNDPDIMEDVLAKGKADIVVAARAFLADPDFPKKARTGHADQIIHCMRCSSCNSVGFIPHVPFSSGVLRCSVNPTLGREFETSHHQTLPDSVKKVLVAGGGPSGMEAALTAARRGHQVILCEKSDRLGANLYYADGIPFKSDLVAYRKSIIANVEQCDRLEVKLNTPVTAELIKEEKPDVLIAACGAVPVIPQIPGINLPIVHHVTDMFHGNIEPGKRVVIIGGGQAGCEEALALASKGHEVHIVEPQPELAREAYFVYWKHMLRIIAATPGITAMCSTQVKEISDNGVTVITQDGKEKLLSADTVLIATGMTANNEMLNEWEPLVPDLRIIGDCEHAARIIDAVRSGYCAGYSID